VQLHGIVQASNHNGHGVKSVCVDHLHVRGRCVVSMASATAIAMPAQVGRISPEPALDNQKIRIAARYFRVRPQLSAQIRADRVALYLLVTSTDGV
jgi:hypothetical protein